MDWRRIVVRVALAMTCGLAACTADNPSRSVENTATTSSAGTQSLTITLRLPNTTNITAATVASTEGIEVGKHSRVDGPVTTAGELEVGHHAEVGAITAIGNASLAQHSRVRGDVHVSGELRRHHHALVDGEIRTNAPLAPGDVTWTIEASDQSSGHVELEPGQLRDLAPGTYGDLVVPSRARVVLHSGIYLFERLVVGTVRKFSSMIGAGPRRFTSRTKSGSAAM